MVPQALWRNRLALAAAEVCAGAGMLCAMRCICCAPAIIRARRG